MLVHYDLFAGIGGFSLAIDEVFPYEPIIRVFAEWEPFPTAVLKRHWPNALYYGDIAELVADSAGEIVGPRSWVLYRILRQNAPSILTGGFPCQPFTVAGQRRGTADDRYKWPEMFAVIRHVRPTWVIAENVPGLVTWQQGMVLERVCADLESEGYDVQPLLIPACAVNAPHRRERLWILAHQTAPNAARVREQERQGTVRSPSQRPEPTDAQRRGERLAKQQWDREWTAVATELCRMGDGLPIELDGRILSAACSRQEQLKAYGNAIVPQVAVRILQAIKHAGFTDQTSASKEAPIGTY